MHGFITLSLSDATSYDKFLSHAAELCYQELPLELACDSQQLYDFSGICEALSPCTHHLPKTLVNVTQS